MTRQFLCVGDLDVDLMAAVSRLPGTDDKVSGRHLGLTTGGMAANVAVGLARLGTASRLVAAVGDDGHGRTATQALEREGVDTRFLVRCADTTTFMCVVLLAGDGEKALVRLETDAYLPRPEAIAAAAFDGVDHVHLTFGDPALTLHSLDLAKAANASVSLDLEQADLTDDRSTLARVLGGIEILFMNRRTRADLEARFGADILAPVPQVVTTLGADGSRLETPGGRIDSPGFPLVVRDSTGAGDGFVAAYLHYRLVERRPPPDVLRRANAAAAMAVGQVGAQTGLPGVADIERFLVDGGAPAAAVTP